MSSLLKLVSLSVLSLVLSAAAAGAQTAKVSKQDSIHAGQQVYLQRCLPCHSINRDQVLLGPSLWGEMTVSPHKKSAAEIRVILRDGKGKMPPWKDLLSEEDIANLLAYLRTL